MNKILFSIVLLFYFNSFNAISQIKTPYEKGVVYLINGDSLSGYVRVHTTYKNQIKYKNEQMKKRKILDHKQVKAIKVTSENGITRIYEYRVYQGRKIPRLLCKIIDDDLSLYYTFSKGIYISNEDFSNVYCPEEKKLDNLCIEGVYIGKKDNFFVQYFKKDFFKDCNLADQKFESLKGKTYWESVVKYYNENCFQ